MASGDYVRWFNDVLRTTRILPKLKRLIKPTGMTVINNTASGDRFLASNEPQSETTSTTGLSEESWRISIDERAQRSTHLCGVTEVLVNIRNTTIEMTQQPQQIATYGQRHSISSNELTLDRHFQSP